MKYKKISEKESLVIMFKLKFLLAFLSWTVVEGCMYTFSSTPDPMGKLQCDPHGSELQLYCAATGPVSPHFHLNWYSTSSENENLTRLDSNMDGYHISTTLVDVIGELQQPVRSTSSILKLGPVSETHADHCIWCQVDFDEHKISLSRDDYKLCLLDGAEYVILPSCDTTTIVFDSSSFCATSEDFKFPPDLKASQEGAMELFSTPTLPPLPSATAPLPDTSKYIVLATLVAETTSSNYHPHSTASSIGITVLSGYAGQDVISGQPNSTNPDDQSSSVKGGLFAAIAICILFIFIIIILMFIVIRLLRQWKLKRENNSVDDENEDTNPRPGRSTASVPTIAHGYSIERFQMDSESLFLSNLEENGNGILTTRSLQDISAKRQIVPPLPPKPWKGNMTKASSASKLQSGSLSHGYNNFTFPEHRLNDHFMESTVPPPIPVRSKSRDHFYHTLECSNKDSGLGLSPPHYSLAHHSSSLAMEGTQSHQVEDLFDDPRYVMVTVEGPEDGGLRGRKELWRSTPALTSTAQW